MNNRDLQQRVFLFLLIAVSVAFGWIILPFFGAVFWGVVLAILFTPVYQRLLVLMRRRRNLAALATVLLCLVMVIIPITLLTASLMQEGITFYQQLRTRELDFGTYVQQVITALPPWMYSLLDRFEITDAVTLQQKLSAAMVQGSQFIATRALQVGQNIFEFLVSLVIMLYLLFFLFRDGASLSEKIKQMTPLSPEHKRILFSKFTTVIRATVKGNIVVAAVQGMLGGAIFWVLGVQGALLWGVLMAFLSLLPAIGSGLVWGPVALYFFVTGSIIKGMILVGFGALVIGLIDNVLRPILVGKDIQMPDYVVLLSTLGGLALFGLNGFVIGPIIAALFIDLWEIFSSTKNRQKN
jgi:predicted PurR-regulated permease PerM